MLHMARQILYGQRQVRSIDLPPIFSHLFCSFWERTTKDCCLIKCSKLFPAICNILSSQVVLFCILAGLKIVFQYKYKWMFFGIWWNILFGIPACYTKISDLFLINALFFFGINYDLNKVKHRLARVNYLYKKMYTQNWKQIWLGVVVILEQIFCKFSVSFNSLHSSFFLRVYCCLIHLSQVSFS